MNVKKVISLATAACLIIIGVTLIIFSVLEKDFPTLLPLAFSVQSVVNAAMFYRNSKQEKWP